MFIIHPSFQKNQSGNVKEQSPHFQNSANMKRKKENDAIWKNELEKLKQWISANTQKCDAMEPTH